MRRETANGKRPSGPSPKQQPLFRFTFHTWANGEVISYAILSFYDSIRCLPMREIAGWTNRYSETFVIFYGDNHKSRDVAPTLTGNRRQKAEDLLPTFGKRGVRGQPPARREPRRYVLRQEANYVEVRSIVMNIQNPLPKSTAKSAKREA